jgi:hypothetical protein
VRARFRSVGNNAGVQTSELSDGQWYSIILRSPRTHRYAQWNSGLEAFCWQGTSETHDLGLEEVAEVLERVDEPAPGYGLS